jgi:hypothetical protein
MSIRGAQFLLLLPLGALQLVATIVFSITEHLAPGEYVLAVWAPLMAIACIITAWRLARGRLRTLRTALLLLAAQTAFSLINLTVEHESAPLVVLAIIAACAALLALPASRRHFRD